MSNISFHFRHKFHHAALSPSIMSHHQVNNKCNRVKRTLLKMAKFMSCVIFYYFITCYVFSEATTTVLESFKFHKKTPVLESLFLLKMMKLYKDICSACISRTSAEIFFSYIDVINISKIQ